MVHFNNGPYHKERKMKNDDFHKPFIKSMMFVAFITIVSMISSHYLINYYGKHSISSIKTIEYSSQKSQDSTIVSSIE
jgi:hypothetical protein